MVDLEKLANRARSIAERSRVRMALRVALIVLPLACIPIGAGANAGACICLGGVLLALTALLRWRDRSGRDAVTTGLALGSIPLIAAVGLRACGIECAQFWSLGEAEVACFAAGAIAGVAASLLVSRADGERRKRWLMTLGVASLTATLGCVGLGTAGILSTLVAMIASATIVWIPVSLRAS
jgi:hypothetical protein